MKPITKITLTIIGLAVSVGSMAKTYHCPTITAINQGRLGDFSVVDTRFPIDEENISNFAGARIKVTSTMDENGDLLSHPKGKLMCSYYYQDDKGSYIQYELAAGADAMQYEVLSTPWVNHITYADCGNPAALSKSTVPPRQCQVTQK